MRLVHAPWNLPRKTRTPITISAAKIALASKLPLPPSGETLNHCSTMSMLAPNIESMRTSKTSSPMQQTNRLPIPRHNGVSTETRSWSCAAQSSSLSALPPRPLGGIRPHVSVLRKNGYSIPGKSASRSPFGRETQCELHSSVHRLAHKLLPEFQNVNQFSRNGLLVTLLLDGRQTGSDRGCEHASVTAWVDVATPKRWLREVGRPLQCKQLKLALMGGRPPPPRVPVAALHG